MKTWAFRLAGLVLVVLSACGLAVRSTAHDPAVWHVDPAVAERTGQPNDFLLAPDGATAATPDRTLTLADPNAALGALDAVARAAPRTEVVAGSVADGFITYVQRSAVFGFPDYITVKAVEGGLVVWSRARFGYSDLGVNRTRIERWLAESGIDPPA